MGRSRAKPKKTRAADAHVAQTLTEENFKTLHPFGTFIITDSEGESHKFSKDDIVAVLPTEHAPGTPIEDWQYWIGKIKEIRAETHADDTNTVWAKVQWFYSAKDVADVVKSFNIDAISNYERIFSDQYDYLESESFNAVISMAKFDEKDLEPPYIPKYHFFRRYTFEKNLRSLQPKPGSVTCTCNNPYNPNDNAPSRVMHFCPRPSCRRAYHQDCLLNSKSKESAATQTIVSNPRTSVTKVLRSARKHASPVKKPPVTPVPTESNRPLRLLATSPDTDANVDLESLIPLTVVQATAHEDSDGETASQPARKKRRSVRTKKPVAALQAPRSLSDILAELPAELLEVAQQPMVRGGAFPEGGVSGNVAFVTRARRLVYQILEGSTMPDNWKREVFGDEEEAPTVKNAVVKIAGSKKALPLVVCPNCKSAI